MMSEEYTIRNITFVQSTDGKRPENLPGRPEIAFAGRSNAGKSSLINYLAGRKKLAYTGKQPGKTRLINYFLVNDDFYLVDLPGYGYANASHQEQASWARMMDVFFADTERLSGLVLCLDLRHEPSKQDMQMASFASYYALPFIVAATKCDKIAKSKRPQYAAIIRKALMKCDPPLEAAPDIIAVSSTEKIGAPELLEKIHALIENAREK